jgi:2-amino-4-hydroxy-6-hydroxymethyldihydropteridine diphosphokinase
MQPASSSTTAYVSLGSNLGDRAENLKRGLQGMHDAGLAITRLSQVYETEPVETVAQPQFLNMVAEVKVAADSDPETMMSTLLQVEQSLGRTRDSQKGPRTIDLDLLLYGKQIVDTPLLTLPHPRLAGRRFVLAPLAGLCPQLQHPVLKQTVAELLQQTTDKSEVQLWFDEGNEFAMLPLLRL